MFEHLHNHHKGETCYVIGNGPSLRDVPNDVLHNFATLGSNRIYLKMIPTYYAVVNELLINQYLRDIQQLPTTKFVRERTRIKNAFELHLIETPMFSFAPTQWLWDGHNTTFVLLQLAFFMGFSKVLLVGVDHRYSFNGLPNEKLLMDGDDPNHFSDEYFKGKYWQAPDLEVSNTAYKTAKEAYERNGRQIVNVTRDSALDVFDFEEPGCLKSLQ